MNGMNGHWVRTRTDEGAKAFLAERALDQRRREHAAARRRGRRADALAFLRRTWRRLLDR